MSLSENGVASTTGYWLILPYHHHLPYEHLVHPPWIDPCWLGARVPGPHAVVGFEEDPIRQQDGHMRHRPQGSLDPDQDPHQWQLDQWHQKMEKMRRNLKKHHGFILWHVILYSYCARMCQTSLWISLDLKKKLRALVIGTRNSTSWVLPDLAKWYVTYLGYMWHKIRSTHTRVLVRWRSFFLLEFNVCWFTSVHMVHNPMFFSIWGNQNQSESISTGIIPLIWVCLKIGYIPNEIAIFHRDNDQQNHWVQGYTTFSDKPISLINQPSCNSNVATLKLFSWDEKSPRTRATVQIPCHQGVISAPRWVCLKIG